MPEGRLQAERQWHEDLYQKRQGQELIVSADITARYLKPPSWPLFPLELMFRLLGDVREKQIVCFGCGDENSTVLLALKGAHVWAFDVSHEASEIQQRMAAANGVADRVHIVVCAGEQLPFPSSFFDIVFGSAVLHHLPDSLATVSSELVRILKETGFALFCEPVAQRPLLQRLRAQFPTRDDISPGERRLTEADLLALTRHFDLETFPFHFLTRLDRFLLDAPLRHVKRWRRSLVYLLHGLDSLILHVPFLGHFAGVIVMKLSRRSSGPTQTNYMLRRSKEEFQPSG